MSERVADRPERNEEPTPSALSLATKLLGLAQAQLEALQRDAQSQFDWLALRRNLVTDRIQSAVAAGTKLPPGEAAAVARLRDQLAEVDRAMEMHVRGRMQQVRRQQAALTRRRKVASPYLLPALRRPVFIDRAL